MKKNSSLEPDEKERIVARGVLFLVFLPHTSPVLALITYLSFHGDVVSQSIDGNIPLVYRTSFLFLVAFLVAIPAVLCLFWLDYAGFKGGEETQKFNIKLIKFCNPIILPFVILYFIGKGIFLIVKSFFSLWKLKDCFK